MPAQRLRRYRPQDRPVRAVDLFLFHLPALGDALIVEFRIWRFTIRMLGWLIAVGYGAAALAQAPASDNSPAIPPDIPVPPGFKIDFDDALIFDKPGGRIVQIEMTGPGNWQALRRFFLESLTQLGWRRQNTAGDAVSMTRGAEQVTIVEVGDAENLHLRFEIKPRPR